MEHAINKIPINTLKDNFEVDSSTGVLYRIKVTNGAPIGKVGYDNCRGYLRVYFKGKHYLVHQIIWRLVHRGSIPEDRVLDHINRNTKDNRPENLRAITPSDNKLNAGPYNTNKTGKRGVTLNKGKNKYESTLTINRKRVWLGQYSTVEEAISAREHAEKLYGVA